MKLRTNLLFIALGCILFSSCNTNSPKPCFEMICESLKQMDQILAGEDVLLSNCTDNGMSFSWDFGDGTNSTLNSPHHVWETPGDYTITLIAENEDASKTLTQDITVSPSLYGEWEGVMYQNDNELLFTLDITQSAHKIKGNFSPAGNYRATGVLSSNSTIYDDSVVLHCALITSITFGDQTLTYSNLFKFEGTVNEALDQMGGDKASVNDYEYDSWEAIKK